MSRLRLSRELAEQLVNTCQSFIDAGYTGTNGRSYISAASKSLKITRPCLHHRLKVAKRDYNLDVKIPKATTLPIPDVKEFNPFPLDTGIPSYTSGHVVELVSRPDNTFLFGSCGDLHAASKYARWDVREDLYSLYREEGVQCNFDTGNWIDGESRFNKYDLEAYGLDEQVRLLARNHPKGIKTYAVWGDDHEGWYVQREGIDVGRYCASIMQAEGHDWTDLGFMEAHILLRNANSGKATSMAVVHPGGGSAYATSYSVQKIIESLEGGEKPGLGLYGHYHKLWQGVVRNVFVAQTGCQQDQTPFMRKKRIEAHVGGTLIKLRQDPETGALISMSCEIIRYFNKAFHLGTGRWSRHGSVVQVPRTLRAAQNEHRRRGRV